MISPASPTSPWPPSTPQPDATRGSHERLAAARPHRVAQRLARRQGPLGSEEVLTEAIRTNRENGERNLELQALGWEEPSALRARRERRRRESGWLRVRLDRWQAWEEEVRLVVDCLHDRYVRPGRFAELHELLERARVRSRWPRALVAGVDLGQLMLELARDGEGRVRMGLAARAKVEREYDLGTMIERTIDLYEETLAASPAPAAAIAS